MNSFSRKFAIIILLLVAYIAAIAVQSWRTIMVNGDKYRVLVSRMKIDSVPIPQLRGFIFAEGGELLAGSLPEYDVYLDFKSTTRQDDDGRMNIPPDTILHYFGTSGAGSKALHTIDARRSSDEWGRVVRDAYGKRQSNLRLFRALSYMDYKRLRTMPYFSKDGNRSGLYKDERSHRYRPYGNTSMAASTIGTIQAFVDTAGIRGRAHGGIEEAYDTYLRGKEGIGLRQRIRDGWRPVDIVNVQPQNGANVHTTINIEMQEILDRALGERIIQLRADAGWGAIMEVKTGKIRAITNFVRTGDSTVIEHYNHLTDDWLDPGSTFKTVSYMVMLDAGKITPETKVNTGNTAANPSNWSVYHPNGRIAITVRDDHPVGTVTAHEAIVQSSNIAVGKLTHDAFGKNEQAYLDAVNAIGFLDDMELRTDFPKAQLPVRHSTSDITWTRTSSLVQISYGYENNIPGIYMLAFYNAIANKGRLMRPYLVEQVEKDGKVIIERKPKTINKQICRKETLAAVHRALCDVVERGTASELRTDGSHKQPAFGGYSAGAYSRRVKIAGKTGTAQRNVNGSYSGNGHNVSFVGYFPADDPQYTCIVVISRPRMGGAGAGYQVGPVFCQVAEQVYALNGHRKLNQLTADDEHAMSPTVKRGPQSETHYVLERLNLDTVQFQIADVDTRVTGTVPRVVGMGASDALFMLEQAGLRVSIVGYGTVTQQVPQAGTPIRRGDAVSIILK